MKTLIEIATEIFGTVLINRNEYFELDEGGLKELVNAVNAQNSEIYGYVDIQYLGDGYRIIYVDDNSNSRYTNDRFLPLYTTPKTLPPEWAKWIELIEGALEDECGGRCNAENNPCWARELLLSKPKG